MKISFTNYPVDIILCILWSLTLLPIALFDIQEILRIILGLPFVLFIPGYILVFALFPARKTDTGIDIIERIGLSFGLSIAIVPLIGLILNYTPMGIRLEPILLSVFIFIIIIGFIGIFRWTKTDPDERFTVTLDISLPKSESNLNKALTIILIITIIIAIASLIYIILNPRTGEKFTEFYLLDSEGDSENYTKSINLGENVTGIIGIANHEYKTVNYTVEIWLLNQTYAFNETLQKNQTTIHNMWYLDKITITLDHYPIDLEKPWTSQWEESFSIPINQSGSFKVLFLLFKSPTDGYEINEDYKSLADEKIKNAYLELYLFINVKDMVF